MVSPKLPSYILPASRYSTVKKVYFGGEGTAWCRVMTLAKRRENTASMLKGKKLCLPFRLQTREERGEGRRGFPYAASPGPPALRFDALMAITQGPAARKQGSVLSHKLMPTLCLCKYLVQTQGPSARLCIFSARGKCKHTVTCVSGPRGWLRRRACGSRGKGSLAFWVNDNCLKWSVKVLP